MDTTYSGQLKAGGFMPDLRESTKHCYCAVQDSGANPPGQRLLATATYTHQHGISPRQGDDPGDAADVLHGLLEENQVHDSIGLVVLCQLVIQRLAQLLIAWHNVVYRCVISCDSHEVVVQQWPGLHLGLQPQRKQLSQTGIAARGPQMPMQYCHNSHGPASMSQLGKSVLQ